MEDRQDQDLRERLQRYYDETPETVSNKDAMKEWQLFMNWCDVFGYSQEDIDKAKIGRFNH